MITKLIEDISEEFTQNNSVSQCHEAVSIASLRDFGKLFLALCIKVLHSVSWFYWGFSALSYICT